ncbi:MAG UNVERIFIED_CONTAM: hypothetical protein LVR29_31055 [Microcystis novacekii LVE1205-3]
MSKSGYPSIKESHNIGHPSKRSIVGTVSGRESHPKLPIEMVSAIACSRFSLLSVNTDE